MAKNRYQSGGAGFNSPEKYVEQVNRTEFMNQVGGPNAISSMDLNAVASQIISYMDKISQNAQLSEARMAEINNSLKNTVLNASNSQQGAKEGMALLNKTIMQETSLLKSMQANIPSINKGQNPIKDVNSSIAKQSVMLEQSMLREFAAFNKTMSGMAERLEGIEGTLYNQGEEEEDLFSSLKDTIIDSALRSPTATALGQLGTGLMNTALLKIAGNERTPEFLKKLAMTGVYMEVPQSLTNIIGDVFTNVISLKLAGAVGQGTFKALGGVPNAVKSALGPSAQGLFSKIGGPLTQSLGGLTKLLPVAGSALAIALAAVVAIGAIFGGVMAHRRKMKEVDAKIDSNPYLNAEQKVEMKKKEHGRSGARAGVASGAIAGAAIGTAIAPGVGTAIGAVLGSVIGGIGGFHIGRNKPHQDLKNMQKHKEMVLKDGGYLSKDVDSQTLADSMDRMEQALLSNTMAQEDLNKEMKSQKEMGFFEKLFGGDKSSGGGGGWFGGKGSSANVDEMLKQDPNLVHMNSLGLNGKISSDNSVPLTTKQNAGNVQFLDAYLQSKGYNVVYTSNMGGQHKGGKKSHASGNKMDFQLFDAAGKPMHLRQEDYEFLQSMGYWGGSTGALGWEKVKGQVGGGHYDVHVGDQINREMQEKYLASLKTKAEKEAFLKAMENMPKTTDDVVEKAKNNSTVNVAPSPAPSGGNSPDNSGSDDWFTLHKMMSATQSLLNRG